MLALQTFNIAYDTGIVPREWYRIQISGRYLIFTYTGEVVDNEKKKRIGCFEELFDPKAIEASDAEALDTDSRLLEELAKQKTVPADIQRRSVMKTSC